MKTDLQRFKPARQQSTQPNEASEDDSGVRTSMSFTNKIRTSESLNFDEDPRLVNAVASARQIAIEDVNQEAVVQPPGNNDSQHDHTASWRDFTSAREYDSEYYRRPVQQERQPKTTTNTQVNSTGSSPFNSKGIQSPKKDGQSLQSKIRKLENMLRIKYSEQLAEGVHIQVPVKSPKRLQNNQPKPNHQSVPRRKIKVSAGLQRSISSRNITIQNNKKAAIPSVQGYYNNRQTERKPTGRQVKHEVSPNRVNRHEQHYATAHKQGQYIGQGSTPVQHTNIKQHTQSNKRMNTKTPTPRRPSKYTTKKKGETRDIPRSSSRSASNTKVWSIGKFFRKEVVRAEQRTQRIRQHLSQRDYSELQNELSLMKLVVEIYQRVSASIGSKLSRIEKYRNRRTANFAAS